jgi:hypothetical protein
MILTGFQNYILALFTKLLDAGPGMARTLEVIVRTIVKNFILF